MSGNYFLGFEVPEEVKGFAFKMMNEFRSLSRDSEWMSYDNLHVTFQFLGKDPSYNLDKKSVFDVYQACVQGFGRFSNKVWYMNVLPSYDLRKLHPDPKKWYPHLTLAKGGVQSFDDSGFYVPQFVFDVPELILYKTVGGGNPYEVVERIAL